MGKGKSGLNMSNQFTSGPRQSVCYEDDVELFRQQTRTRSGVICLIGPHDQVWV